MATLRDLAGDYGLGGGDVERRYARELVDNPNPLIPDPRGPMLVDQLAPIAPDLDPTKTRSPGPVGNDQRGPFDAPAWQHPIAAFGPNVSQNAPRLFQDPTSGQWTLSEHGNFRPLTPEEAVGAQGYVTNFWSQNPTGFIQQGAPGYAAGQAQTNAAYGQPANWQSLWQNAGLSVPGGTGLTKAAPTGGGLTDQGGMGGTLAELSNPERVNALSQSSYGKSDDWLSSRNPFMVR